MPEYKLKLIPLGITREVNDQTPLIDILPEYGVEFPCGGRGTCGKCRVKLIEGTIGVSDAHAKRLMQFKLKSDMRLACFSICTEDLVIELDQLFHPILADESEYEFIPEKGLGIAVDIGTTSLVAQLVDLTSGAVLSAQTMINPQTRYGADLISRIESSMSGNADEMTRMIRKAVETMIKNLLKEKYSDVKRICLVGNTVMNYIFSGKDVSPLSAFPFNIPDNEMTSFNPSELNWDINVEEDINFFPSIGSFIGSDILAGIAATGLYKEEKYTALIDLGTNGEIAVGNKDQIFCASTAAGPAFEGSNISMGMRAVTGAISSIDYRDGNIHAGIIGNAEPAGICGSGLIDAVAILRKLGKIGSFGEILSGEEKIQLTGKVYLSQKDINEFMLAKAAIAAGLYILAGKLSVRPQDIDKIYIAGAFGYHITIENTIFTGMLETHPEKVKKAGNTALIGAKMFLFSGNDLADEILSKTKHFNLESEPGFQDIFVERMLL